MGFARGCAHRTTSDRQAPGWTSPILDLGLLVGLTATWAGVALDFAGRGPLDAVSLLLGMLSMLLILCGGLGMTAAAVAAVTILLCRWARSGSAGTDDATPPAGPDHRRSTGRTDR
jgi:hypothetical protein